ncbi:DUF2087 domain-containing protein [Streptacidiphilus rugosus]|uniref:DUF2087 domain-containing protein n=1 Tax=Streptacidiphilus rugosus TaxID=405783 RepID=UPI00055C621F|nr:DUF2087 domain-containing protein [Streptacidiphilus rugosus]
MPDISLLAPLASALSDQDRLRAYATVVLAGPEGADPAAVAPHAARLQQAGLVEAGADGRLVARSGAFADALRSPAAAEGGAGAELAVFFRDGRLTEIPVRPARRLALLAHLTARVFEPGVSYGEPEVNIALKQYWDDCAALRRYLVENGFLTRSADGTVYRVADPAPSAS